MKYSQFYLVKVSLDKCFSPCMKRRLECKCVSTHLAVVHTPWLHQPHLRVFNLISLLRGSFANKYLLFVFNYKFQGLQMY